MWLLLDKQDLDQDRRLAQHILGVHQGVVHKVGGGARAGTLPLVRQLCVRASASDRWQRASVACAARPSPSSPAHDPSASRPRRYSPPSRPQDEGVGDLVSPELLRAYISLARRQEPFVPPELADYVVAHYCALRQKERDEMDGRSYVTPRTLLSILRLAQAVAKLRFDEEVRRGTRGACCLGRWR